MIILPKTPLRRLLYDPFRSNVLTTYTIRDDFSFICFVVFNQLSVKANTHLLVSRLPLPFSQAFVSTDRNWVESVPLRTWLDGMEWMSNVECRSI